MTVIAAADIPLRHLQDKLGQIGQWLPIDGDPDATVGELVENDSTGPLRLGYGAWRDLLLGVQFTNGSGELITAGGQTVKNVAGYDLTKWMVGQFGVFGRLVTISTRTYRRPVGALHVRLQPDGRIVERLLPTPLRPQWMMWVPGAIWCGYLGDEPTLAFYRERLRELEPIEVVAASLSEDIQRRAMPPVPPPAGERSAGEGTGGTVRFRASVAPARAGDFVDRLPGQNWAADPVYGIVVGSIAENQIADVEDAARQMSGSAWFFLPGKNVRMSEPDPTQRRILEELKQKFDPENRLAPLPWRLR